MLADFEGTLKFFRVNLPKKYMNENCRQDLFTGIYSFKVRWMLRGAKNFWICDIVSSGPIRLLPLVGNTISGRILELVINFTQKRVTNFLANFHA